MSEVEDAHEEVVKVERNLKRRHHEFAADLDDNHGVIKTPKLEVELLHPHRHLSFSKCTSPLLRLPKELRDLIYRCVFFLVLPMKWSKGSIVLEVPSQFPDFRWKSSYHTPLGLLAVNTKIHVEASEILYQYSVFHFDHSWTALNFFKTIGPNRFFMIRRLQFHVPPYHFPHQLAWTASLGITTYDSIYTIQLHNLKFDHYSSDNHILEHLLDVFVRHFRERPDQTIIPLLTLIGFRDIEEGKFLSSWDIVVKLISPRSKITPPAI